MNIDRKCEPPMEHCVFNDVLWSDPHPEGAPGICINRRRGCGLYFGPDALGQFLDQHELDFLVRSHEGPDCIPIPEGVPCSRIVHNRCQLLLTSGDGR